MDLTLPGGLGGREATRQLLDMDREARVIASSGYANDPVMANFAENGFKAVLPKPYSTEELTSTLEAVIDHEDTRDR
jgi:CheY-like chemotaxis protein